MLGQPDYPRWGIASVLSIGWKVSTGTWLSHALLGAGRVLLYFTNRVLWTWAHIHRGHYQMYVGWLPPGEEIIIPA